MIRIIGWALLALGGLGAASCGPSAVVGAGAVVARSVVQERTTMNALKDTEIQLSMNNRMLTHSQSLFADVSSDVTEGRVLLTGSVPTRAEKVDATRIAWGTPGVRTVTDELVVAEDAGAAAYLEDAWVSNRIRFALLTDADVRSLNYNIETVDGVVHVTGLARSRSELNHVLAHAASVSGVVQVVNHVLTIDDPRRIA